MDKIEQITKKFYTTEKERIAKLEKDKFFIQYFLQQNYHYIITLYDKGIKFHVFHFDNNTIHVGLFPCCVDKVIEITPQIRIETEQKLKAMNFKEVIWEDIL